MKKHLQPKRPSLRVLSVLYSFALFLCLCALVIGCIDQRPSPGAGNNLKAKLKKLNSSEWSKVKRNFLTRAPRPRYRLNTTLSIRQGQRNVPAVFVYGVDVAPYPVRRGKPVTVTYYFKPLSKIPNVWPVFLHIEGTGGAKFYMNKDHQPMKGLYPTTRWIPNRIFKSSFTFNLPKSFPSRRMMLWSGFWRGNARMLVGSRRHSDGKNRLRLASVPVYGAAPQLPKLPIYVAYKVKTPPTIDGKLTEPMWSKLPSTGNWYTHNARKARFQTWARMAWDDKYLYLGVYCQDDDIWSTYKRRDDPIYNQEVVEFFIDANRNRRDYIELQVSPAGVIFDSFFPRYRHPRPEGRKNYDSGMLVRIGLNGTLNNPNDRDTSYTVEMRLPLSKLGPAPNLPPKNGDEWAINLYRFERSRRTRGEAHAWSPVTLAPQGDFHNLRRFGTLRFSTRVLTFASAKPKALMPKRVLKRPAPRVRVQPRRKVYHPRIFRPAYKVVPKVLRPKLHVKYKPGKGKHHHHHHHHAPHVLHKHKHKHGVKKIKKPKPRNPGVLRLAPAKRK